MKSKIYIPNIPETNKKRIVVIGGGFAGLKFIRKTLGRGYQIVLLDKNNFHQFQPLLYQVATAGLEPSAISFPLRKILQNEKNVHFRIARVIKIDPMAKEVHTTIGYLKYDMLVLSVGARTNFFGQDVIEENALSMKSAADAILIRNTILQNFEAALLETSQSELEKHLNIILVGGGPTGVELAGALAEMKKYIFPKDYPELDLSKMRIVLYEGSSRLLSGMSQTASQKALEYLERLGVEVYLNTRVNEYNGTCLKLSDNTTVTSKMVIWAAGIAANPISGIPNTAIGRGNRIKVNRLNLVQGLKDVYAIGDISLMETNNYPNGHPQVAQVAIQQANNLAHNLIKHKLDEKSRAFEYRDKGSMATIGRNQAVADLPFGRLKGFIAWVLWSIVHLFTIVGVKNRLFIFLNWSWNYFTYDQSLRLLIRHKPPRITHTSTGSFTDSRTIKLNQA